MNKEEIFQNIDQLTRIFGVYHVFKNTIGLLFLKRLSNGKELSKENIPSFVSDFELNDINSREFIPFYEKIMSQEGIDKALSIIQNLDDENDIKEIIEGLYINCKNDVDTSTMYSSTKALREIATILLDIEDNETYLDPFCGYSSSLLSLKTHPYYIGVEKVNEISMISKMVSTLLHFENSRIENKDFLETNIVADKVFADVPLGTRGEREHIKKIADNLGLQTNDIDLLMYYKSYLAIQKKGVIVVPSKVLFSNQSSYKEFRETLRKGGLKAIISLPAIKPGVAISISLLYIDKDYDGLVQVVDASSMGKKIRGITVISEKDVEHIFDIIIHNKQEEGISSSVNKDQLCDDFVVKKFITEPVKNKQNITSIENELLYLYKKLIHNFSKYETDKEIQILIKKFEHNLGLE